MSNLSRVLERQQKQREEIRRRRAQEDWDADEEKEQLLAAAVCMMDQSRQHRRRRAPNRDASSDITKLGLQPGQNLPLGFLGLVGPTMKPGYGLGAGAISGSLWQPFTQFGLDTEGALRKRSNCIHTN
ncbi:unnamed protein product [Prunus armeniaca]